MAQAPILRGKVVYMRRYWAFVLLLLPAIVAGCASGLVQPGQVVLDVRVAEGALNHALTRLGSTYVLGAQGPWSFDCSGLVIWSYQQAYPALMLRDELRSEEEGVSSEEPGGKKPPPAE